MSNDLIHLYVESPDGDRFECEVPEDTFLSRLAADFFEDRGWPTRDSYGRGRRAVVELVDPENSERTKRLRGEQTIDDAGLWDGAVLQIFPEATAGCFLGSVKVNLADGGNKPIQYVERGDLLLSGVPDTKFPAVTEVRHVFRGFSYDYLAINDRLLVTESHPIWANGEWTRAGELKVGDLLQDHSGRQVKLWSIEQQRQLVRVYNLYVSHTEHTFFAEDLLVHNMHQKAAVFDELARVGVERVEYFPFEILVNQLKDTVTLEEYQLLQAVVEKMQSGLRSLRLYSRSLEERIEKIEAQLSMERVEFHPTLPQIDYTLGLEHLGRLISSHPTEVRKQFHILEARLLGWLKEERNYGPSEITRQGKMQVIASLNELVIGADLGQSFIDLCRC